MKCTTREVRRFFVFWLVMNVHIVGSAIVSAVLRMQGIEENTSFLGGFSFMILSAAISFLRLSWYRNVFKAISPIRFNEQ